MNKYLVKAKLLPARYHSLIPLPQSQPTVAPALPLDLHTILPMPILYSVWYTKAGS